ncbi:Ppx/GppA phosphatase family protein [Metabacillus sp. JX24]|uniref:Ppx/GppA phosphatase family protein n=1 Tax=Metabacillus sp. JX24 TaxID=3240759 RepID=UPI00350F04C6
MIKEKYAIIDIGSNTMRLVIYQRDKSRRLKEIENVKISARLRNYLTDESILNDEGITVLVSSLLSFQEVTRHHDLKNVKCAATATVRQAVNKDAVLGIVKEKTDFTIRILSEYEEAYYGFLAAVNSTQIRSGITIDIGGGSTEITYFENRKLINYHSFPFGALSLKKEFVKGEKPTKTELHELKLYLEENFKTLPWLINKRLPVVGIGGSARNIVQIHQAMQEYPLAGVHLYEMSANDLLDVQQFLSPMSMHELQRTEGLSKDRADIILPAAQVFVTLSDITASDRFILSRKGLRDGVFYEELTRGTGTAIFPSVIEESFHELLSDYDIDLDHVQHVTKIALELYSGLAAAGKVSYTEEDIRLIRKGSFVYNLGQYIDSESSSQHTFYLIANRTIDGLSHRDRLKLALIASFKSKSAYKQYSAPFKHWFSKVEQHNIMLLGAIIKFAYSLNATKRNVVRSVSLQDEIDRTVCTIFCEGNFMPEEYQAEKQKKNLEKLLKKNIQLKFQQ